MQYRWRADGSANNIDRMPLFDPDCDPQRDLATLVRVAETMLQSKTSERLWHQHVHQSPVWRLVPFLRSDVLPPAAICLAAGAHALELTGNWRSVWHAAQALAEGEPPRIDHVETDAELFEPFFATTRELEAKIASAAEPSTRAWYEWKLEMHRHALAQAFNRKARHARGEVVAAALLAAPIGAGDVEHHDELEEDRSWLSVQRLVHPAWNGMRLLLDACGAGSHAAVEELMSFTKERAQGRPWLLWLNEASLVISGHAAARDARAALDRALAEDHANGELARSFIEIARKQLSGERLDRIHDAWLAQSAIVAAPPNCARDEPDEEVAAQPKRMHSPEHIAAVKKTLAIVEEFFRTTRAYDESLGPFAYRYPPPEVGQALMSGLWAARIGFRALYGIELMRSALADLYGHAHAAIA
jgi:hypothetical protein